MIEYIYEHSQCHDHFGKSLDAPMLTQREEVVRCRDCKHYYEAENYHPSGNFVRRCCKYFDSYMDEVEPDGFCAWGERVVDKPEAERGQEQGLHTVGSAPAFGWKLL